VETKSPFRGEPQRNRLGDLRIGGYDHINAQRYVEQGELLADLALRVSRGIRTLVDAALKVARNAFAHNRNLAKNRIAQID
jgi:hypothetical protein